MSERKKIQIRGGFSDRMQIQPLNTEIQLKEFDNRTRTAIANLVVNWYEMTKLQDYVGFISVSVIENVYNEFVSEQIKQMIKYDQPKFIEKYIYLPIMDGSYDDILSFVEYFANLLTSIHHQIHENDWSHGNYMSKEFNFEQSINELFEKEYVGYRMVDGIMVPISDDIEINEIKETLDSDYEGCHSHITKALGFLSDRENPDYKNCIKESISAVENICQILVGDTNATLGKALKKLESNGIYIHKSMEEAFSKLYGYASDEGGIRHAEGMFESDVSFEDAKFMLVACSAFINYLIGECAKNDEK